MMSPFYIDNILSLSPKGKAQKNEAAHCEVDLLHCRPLVMLSSYFDQELKLSSSMVSNSLTLNSLGSV